MIPNACAFEMRTKELCENMNIAEHPTIRELASCDERYLSLFSPVERAVIETCKEIVEKRSVEKA